VRRRGFVIAKPRVLRRQAGETIVRQQALTTSDVLIEQQTVSRPSAYPLTGRRQRISDARQFDRGGGCSEGGKQGADRHSNAHSSTSTPNSPFGLTGFDGEKSEEAGLIGDTKTRVGVNGFKKGVVQP
jgi:hypothetical protein